MVENYYFRRRTNGDNSRSFYPSTKRSPGRSANMTQAAKKMLQMSIESLQERDVAKAKEVISLDDIVDSYNYKIEDKCLRMIALQQPVAKDLRVIAAVMKIITDVERIGDYSIDIAKFSIRLADKPLFKPLIDVPKMADIVVKMLEETSATFIQKI